jgi:hypothetical protein
VGSGAFGWLAFGQYSVEAAILLTLDTTLPWESSGFVFQTLTLDTTLPVEARGFVAEGGNYLGGGGPGLGAQFRIQRTRPDRRRVRVRIVGRSISKFSRTRQKPKRLRRRRARVRRVESQTLVTAELLARYRVFSEARVIGLAGESRMTWDPWSGVQREDDEAVLALFMRRR